jgi:hypothetical protein
VLSHRVNDVSTLDLTRVLNRSGRNKLLRSDSQTSSAVSSVERDAP